MPGALGKVTLMCYLRRPLADDTPWLATVRRLTGEKIMFASFLHLQPSLPGP
jgi:hypothetical protein